MKKIFEGTFNTFVSGGIIGFFFVICWYILDSPLGLTDGYLVFFDYIEDSVSAKQVLSISFDWQIAFIFGILIGGIITAIIGKHWDFNFSPEDQSGKGIIAKAGITPLQGILGGFLIMLGFMLSGDSFFGHWANAIQLSIGAWLFLILTFIFAALSAKFIFKGGE